MKLSLDNILRYFQQTRMHYTAGANLTHFKPNYPLGCVNLFSMPSLLQYDNRSKSSSANRSIGMTRHIPVFLNEQLLILELLINVNVI